VLVAASTCDFNAIGAAQRAYITSNSDPIIGYIADLKKAYTSGQYLTANGLVYAIGRQVALERLTPATTDATSGGIFLIDVLRCLTNLSTSAPEQIPPKFLDNATRVVSSGIWEIRGGTTNVQFPAAGRVRVGGTGDRAFGLPRWGVEAVSGTWPGSTEYVVFGYPTASAVIAGSPANININEFPASGFELGSIPIATPKTGLRVGECIARSSSTGVTNRIVHGSTEVLDFSALSDLCSTTITGYQASAGGTDSWYASFLQRAGTLLAPKLAFAQCTLLCSSTGGLPSDWSPFTADAITAASIVLSFDNAPHTNTTVGSLETVIVRAAIPGPTSADPATPVPGVFVTISIAGNSGQAGGATFNNGGTSVTGTTGPDGTASITYSIGKAGGYTLSTTGSIDGFPVGNSLSSPVWVKNP
jgi:hypothetical protein